MAQNFLKVSCKDCGNETTIYSRATSVISCGVCGATLTSPSAGKHTMHTIERVKKKRASELKWGQRRFRKVMAGYRGFPRPKPDGREKPTKRVNILFRCTETGKAHYAPCQRAKKFELVDK